ncbi:CBS domain-containing protein [Methanoculleus sp.]|uniref:CBS domain-containing protein n=1 Tax=Methanoculleus sp. TaxID=90427 RepID=UPI0025D71D0C|nr:CBS domain-containing protein [Methanoculleus sp.]MCK9317942.1 CBS domain-containing protein [Methanoculleus sp.]MDD2253958.1 CBS domain-containing protein [Methanoculleus sp.]MDD2786700.1 CBS domain-containing protein [Methanoculleus sp.]MDD3216500.1 CBS domain-containing protein [Methanoculleus sp.]MDD4314463.1 CBS domain-containing protein [Methanoculleus sp.]
MSEKYQILVKDVMTKPVTIAKSAFVSEALEKMLDEGVDPLIVTNNGTVIGTTSRAAIAETLGSKKTQALKATSIHVANTVEENFTSAYPDQSLDILVPLLQHYKLVVVLDAEHRLIGQVTAGDLLKVLRPAGALTDVVETANTIQVEERAVHLRRRMLDGKINRFIVEEGDQVIGIVTETDVAKALYAFKDMVEDTRQEYRIRNLLVRDIMSTPLISMDVNTDISDVIDLMLKKNISSVPVMQNGKITGVVTRNALVQAL